MHRTGPWGRAGRPSRRDAEDDPSWSSAVDGLTVADLGERGLLWGGEGSYGTEGLLARLTADRALIRALFFRESSPFDRIRGSGNVATFRSTLEIEIAVDIHDPRRGEG